MPSKSLISLFSLVLKHHRQRRDYRHLLKLDEHLLADVGLNREQIQRELARPYWATLRLSLRCSRKLSANESSTRLHA